MSNRYRILASLSTDANGNSHERYAETVAWTGNSRLRALIAFWIMHRARPDATLTMTWRGRHDR